MSNLSVNGVQTGGNIHELQLKPGQTIYDAKTKGSDDGLDQIYFKVGDQHYVAEGDGLELSGFDKGFIPEAILFTEDGKHTPVQILSIDNEVNTAWEGVKHVGKVSIMAVTGGALGGTVIVGQGVKQMLPAAGLVSEGVGFVKAGFVEFKAGMIPVQQGMHTSIDAVQKVIGTGSTVTTTAIAKPSSSWIGKIVDGVGGLKDKAVNTVTRVSAAPQAAKEVGRGLEMIQTGSVSVEKGLVLTETAVTKFDKSVTLVEKGTPYLKKGMYVVGIGLAIAGTIATGGAIYGAARGQDEEALSEFRGKAVQ